MTELKPCPFCGKQTATVKHSRNWGYFVSCQCTAVGPGRATAQAAKDAWNKRTEPVQAVLPL